MKIALLRVSVAIATGVMVILVSRIQSVFIMIMSVYASVTSTIFLATHLLGWTWSQFFVATLIIRWGMVCEKLSPFERRFWLVYSQDTSLLSVVIVLSNHMPPK